MPRTNTHTQTTESQRHPHTDLVLIAAMNEEEVSGAYQPATPIGITDIHSGYSTGMDNGVAKEGM